MGVCAGVCHLDHTQLSQETKKRSGRLTENVRGKRALAENCAPKIVPNATQLVGSHPLKGALGYGDMPLQQQFNTLHGERQWKETKGAGHHRRVEEFAPAHGMDTFSSPPASRQWDLVACHHH